MILGVSFDAVDANHAFAEKYGFGFRLLCDTDRSLGVAYGAADSVDQATARRAGVIIDPDGAIFQWHAKVSSREFPAQALAAIPG